MEGMQNDLSQKIDNIQYSISRLTNLNTVNEKGKFPSQPSQNPKGVHEVETQEGESSKLREVKVVITLRSGKEVDQPLPNVRQDEELMSKKTLVKESNNQEEKSGKKSASKSSIEEEPRIVIKEDMMKKHMPPPFPQALHGKKEIKNSSEILEVLRQVKVNIPLLDMIKQVLTYAKFLKDLCMVKRGLHVTKNAFLTEQVSAIIQTTGTWRIEAHSHHSLLADRLVKIPRGVIEDVLVQVDKFYYPMDFVVLDIDPTVKEANYVPIILGRPFLATSNAIINCRNGVMQLTFGNMTLELNIFHLCKRHLHPEEEEGLEEVCLINTLVEEHCDKNLEERLNESLEVLEEGLPEPSDVLAIMSPWRRKEEILPLFNEEDSKGTVRENPPKLVLKPLPVDLNANFIWDPGKLSQDQIFDGLSLSKRLANAPPHLADSASQSRYHTRRAFATPVAPTQIPPRGPPTKKAKTSKPGESSRAPRDSQSQPPSTRRPRPSSPIEGNSDFRSKAFHVEAYFKHTILRQQTDLLDSYILLERYHLVPFMTPPQFFYPRVVLDFYQSMTTRGVPIAEAFHIPYAPADPTAFRRWAPLSEWGMEKVHKRRLMRAASIQLLFPRLLCHVLAHMGFPADPQAEPRRHCQESFSLDQWTQLSLHQHSPKLPEPREVLPAPSTSAPSEPVPEAASSDAPPTVPPTTEPPITIPGSEYRALLASFQTLTTTQTAIMERMGHFQIQQDQQTLILREIQ
ncbi:hypothetical protein CK203_062304 [Vitis vinifera]|uniref:Uncharacterized protein n=1 Tax=Vitis vinifera TaxID=29760 RepID=A0A438GD08_VITVI|nr:hypothetical protein CK203_062304 [Vitis vinifera]